MTDSGVLYIISGIIVAAQFALLVLSRRSASSIQRNFEKIRCNGERIIEQGQAIRQNSELLMRQAAAIGRNRVRLNAVDGEAEP